MTTSTGGDVAKVDQPGAAPSRKIAAATTTGAATIVVLWLAKRFGLEMTTEVAEAIVLLAAGGAGYITREIRGRHAA